MGVFSAFEGFLPLTMKVTEHFHGRGLEDFFSGVESLGAGTQI